MRRLVVALVAATLVLSLAGCGGSEPEPPPAAPPVTAAPVAAPAPAAAADPKNAPQGWSANEGPVFLPFPSGSTIPTEVAELIDAKQPTLIYFYDASQNSSKETRKIVDGVLEKHRGLVELVAYDIGKYVSGDAAKPVTVDADFSQDTTYQAQVGLAKRLDVSYTPFIVLTDNQGFIVWRFKGLGDRDVIEREVLRASN